VTFDPYLGLNVGLVRRLDQCRTQGGGQKTSSLRRPQRGQRRKGSTGAPHLRQDGFIGTTPRVPILTVANLAPMGR
jgi:hypothetical protein